MNEDTIAKYREALKHLEGADSIISKMDGGLYELDLIIDILTDIRRAEILLGYVLRSNEISA